MIIATVLYRWLHKTDPEQNDNNKLNNNKKLKDGLGVGKTARLTDAFVNKIQSCYDAAI